MPVHVSDGLVTCGRCAVEFDPRPVGGACPVCRTPAPGHPVRHREQGDHALALVAVATVANIMLLAVLAVLLLR